VFIKMQAMAVAHPNVALIKYWGKSDLDKNLPATGSLSITLGGLHTRTRVEFVEGLAQDRLLLGGKSDIEAGIRMSRCLDQLRQHAGCDLFAVVESTNDFPTGAGLASSASGFAALTKAGAAALNLVLPAQELARIARLGSGSAPRSLFAGAVLLDITSEPGQTVCTTISGPKDWPLEVIIAITSADKKDVSSTAGMESSRLASPYFEGWVSSHPADLEAGLACFEDKDFTGLAELAEYNCLKMHSLAMSTNPPLLYWSPATLACMQAIVEMRSNGIPVFFTVDAGPQVKAVCLPGSTELVREKLQSITGVIKTLDCKLGQGAWVDLEKEDVAV
jgi:diphosphomevalonate decarboxylase